MGSRMVNNLLEAGNKVVVYDSNQVGRTLATPLLSTAAQQTVRCN
jgi:3-hydroxyisobutyrate dehydrogenase-like beta-hydroxyacid dehydrogenase